MARHSFPTGNDLSEKCICGCGKTLARHLGVSEPAPRRAGAGAGPVDLAGTARDNEREIQRSYRRARYERTGR